MVFDLTMVKSFLKINLRVQLSFHVKRSEEERLPRRLMENVQSERRKMEMEIPTNGNIYLHYFCQHKQFVIL